MNFTQYNYFVWADVLDDWADRRGLGLGKVVDIGCSNGGWLKELARLGLSSQGVGLDISIPTEGTASTFYGVSHKLNQADFLKPFEIDGCESIQTICFMNMLYVLPTNEHVSEFIRRSRPTNLILSVPCQKALNIYDRHHPERNFRNRTLGVFVSDLGYKVVERRAVCSYYYLKNPVRVLLGGFSRQLTQALESNRASETKYYELVWATLDNKL